MIGTSPKISVVINNHKISDKDNIPYALGQITSTSSIFIGPKNITKDELRFKVKSSLNAREQILTAGDLGGWDASGQTIRIDTTKVLDTWYVTAIYSTKRTSLEKYPLENLSIFWTQTQTHLPL